MERVVLVWARPCQVLGIDTAAAGVLILDPERGVWSCQRSLRERFVDLRDEEWATQKRKSVPSSGIRVSNGLEMGECRIALGLSLDRACLRHLLMYSGKARDAHQGSGRVGNLLDVGLKLVPSDRQGSVQVRAL